MKNAEERINRKSFRIKLFIWIGMMALFLRLFLRLLWQEYKNDCGYGKDGRRDRSQGDFFLTWGKGGCDID